LTTNVRGATLHILLLILQTAARRIALPAVLFLSWTPAAHAWSWPLQGPVLEPFAYDAAHPYVAGEHRGVDIGARAAGDTVVTPAAGTVSFAGTVPMSGKSVTIETPDGYAVTLTHLGSILVAKAATVAEGDAVGTVGPSGTPEVDVPYVHLGIRLATDPNGYIDPLGLLPAPTPDDPPADSGTPQPQPTASGAAAGAPAAAEPAPPSAPVATTRGSTVVAGQSGLAHHRPERAQEPRVETRPHRSSRPASHGAGTAERLQHRVRTLRSRPSKPTSTPQRPVVEAAAPSEPTRVATRPSVPAVPARPAVPQAWPVSLLCNGAAALVAVAAALAAARRRRELAGASPLAGAEVLDLPRPALDRRQRHAA
jgi:hypothetical protein